MSFWEVDIRRVNVFLEAHLSSFRHHVGPPLLGVPFGLYSKAAEFPSDLSAAEHTQKGNRNIGNKGQGERKKQHMQKQCHYKSKWIYVQICTYYY